MQTVDYHSTSGETTHHMSSLTHPPSRVNRFVKAGVPESQVAEHLLNKWLLPRIADQRSKIRSRLDIAPDTPIDPKYERMSVSFDGCGPFLFRAVDFVKQGKHEPLYLHLLSCVLEGLLPRPTVKKTICRRRFQVLSRLYTQKTAVTVNNS